jgi:hypothetical protein
MTDISTAAPTNVQRLRLPLGGLARLAIGASIKAMPRLIGVALSMAYVDPYTSLRRPQIVPDDDLEGRDPKW